MNNITNTNPLKQKHTHEKEDIKGLLPYRRIIPIQIGDDDEDVFGRSFSETLLDNYSNIVENTIGQAETTQLGEFLKPGDIVVLTNRGWSNDVYTPGGGHNDWGFGFQGCEILIHKNTKFPPTGSLLLEVSESNLGESTLRLDIIGALGMNADGNKFYQTHISDSNVSNKLPNILYFITET